MGSYIAILTTRPGAGGRMTAGGIFCKAFPVGYQDRSLPLMTHGGWTKLHTLPDKVGRTIKEMRKIAQKGCQINQASRL